MQEIEPVRDFAVQNKDYRLLVLTLHLYTEHWLDEIIREKFRRSEIIFGNTHMRSFENKLQLVEAQGVKIREVTLRNIRLLNRMRNDCVHNLNRIEVHTKIEQRLEDMELPKEAQDLHPIPEFSQLFQKLMLIASVTIIELFYVVKELQHNNKKSL